MSWVDVTVAATAEVRFRDWKGSIVMVLEGKEAVLLEMIGPFQASLYAAALLLWRRRGGKADLLLMMVVDDNRFHSGPMPAMDLGSCSISCCLYV